jgi:hypothetical protein
MAKKARKAKKAGKRSARSADLFELRPLRAAKPVTPFMCFHTPVKDVFIKCDWNPVERRFNLNCRQVGREECAGGQ